jgi:glycosyltransferase involved in cell wall biosynthesis
VVSKQEPQPLSKSTCMLVKNTFVSDARVMREATALTAHGYQVTVIALLGAGTRQHESREGIEIVRVSRGLGSRLRSATDPNSGTGQVSASFLKRSLVRIVRRLGASPLGDLIQHSIDRRMIKVALLQNPDIVHSHDLDTLAAGVKIAKKLNVPLVYDSHEMASGRNLASQTRMNKARKLEAKLIHNADAVIMAANGYAQRAEDLYGITNATVLLNVPDITEVEVIGFDLRTRFGVPEDNLLLVHQGVLLPNRGIDQVIEAMKACENVSLAIIGYGMHVPFLKNLVTQLRLEDRIHFLGAVPAKDLISWSASADVGVCTIVGNSDSYRHSMPNKLFEYAMAGLPVIASNYEGMGTFVVEQGFGITCDPTLIPELVASIETLQDDSGLRTRLAINAKVASSKFNWQVEQEKLLAVYAQLFA